ncbi:MAG: flagellar hook-length control protein FliK [Treponema sp.]|nr:flagellar hook-length control protein FliK [Treponema sp.]
MLSLQSVQAEQVLPQSQVQSLQTQFKMESPEKTGGSFMDLLRSQARIDESEQKPVSQPNDRQNSPDAAQKVSEKNDDNAVQEELPTEKKSQVSKKDEDSEKGEADFAYDGGKITLVMAEKPQISVESQITVTYAPDAEKTITFATEITSDEEVPQTDASAEFRKMAWLNAHRFTSAEDALPAVEDKSLDEAVATLLDEKAFIVPEIDTGDEDLTKVQNLVSENPSLFLQNAESELTSLTDDGKTLEFDGKKIDAQEAKQKPRLTITDLRTQKTDAVVETEQAIGKTQQKNGADLAFEQKNEPQVQMTMELVGNVEQNITSSSTQSAAANGSNFQAMLASSIQENAPEFVKAGNIVLRDGNQGAINLILRPESLGNVKISLSLSDKIITGQITVQSQEAYDAFKDSIDALREAFAQSGFDTQGFDLNFAGNQQFAQSQQEWQNPEFAVRAGQTYGDYVSQGEADPMDMNYENSNYGINIVA